MIQFSLGSDLEKKKKNKKIVERKKSAHFVEDNQPIRGAVSF